MDNLEEKIQHLENRVQLASSDPRPRPIPDGSLEAFCAFRYYLDNTDQTITYDKVHVENNVFGSALDIETGRFVAGQAGIYFVSATVPHATTADNSDIHIYLMTSSGRYQDSEENEFMYQLSKDGDADEGTMSASRYIRLDQGEEVYLDYKCGLHVGNTLCSLKRMKFCVSFFWIIDGMKHLELFENNERVIFHMFYCKSPINYSKYNKFFKSLK